RDKKRDGLASAGDYHDSSLCPTEIGRSYAGVWRLPRVAVQAKPILSRDQKGAVARCQGTHGDTPLSLHAPRSAAFYERLHLLRVETVEVPRDGVFETRRRHCKLESLLVASQRLQPEDQAAGETI